MWYNTFMNKEDCVIYIGEYYKIEWYYDRSGYSQAYEFFLGLDNERRRKFLILVKRIGDAGKINDKTKFRNEDDQIYTFKPQPDRFLCFFFTGKKIIVTNAFTKKSQKLPGREKKRSMECRKDYEIRVKEDGNEDDI